MQLLRDATDHVVILRVQVMSESLLASAKAKLRPKRPLANVAENDMSRTECSARGIEWSGKEREEYFM